MKKALKIILFLVVILGAGFFALISVGRFFIREITQDVRVEDASNVVFAEAGKRAPYFELVDLSGKKIKLPDFLGQVIVVAFWTTWNSASADMLRIFDEYAARGEERQFAIFAINSQEDKSVVRNFMNRGGYDTIVLLDESGEITERYKARTLPVIYFINKEGTVREVVVGGISADMLAEKIEEMHAE